MKKVNLVSLLLFVTVLLTSCELVEGIFKAGMWTAIILIVIVVAIIMWIVGKMRR